MSELEELERAQEIAREKVRALEETIDEQNAQIDSLTGRLQNFSDMKVHRVFMCLCMSLRACARVHVHGWPFTLCACMCVCARALKRPCTHLCINIFSL